MINKIHEDSSLGNVHASVSVKRIFAFFGPAYLVSVGYMDPGNWATDLAGGSKFGYTLIWVLLLSNIIALLLQALSARLGVVRGRDLAQANRELYPRTVNFILYILAEVAIAACDLAEVLGMAIGINLLTGLPLLGGVGLTVLDTFLFLLLQRLGMRKLEAFILALIAIIGASFLIEILMVRPHLGEVVSGFVPRLPNTEALYIAVGIIGATVMPHNLYLHSALVQTRKFPRDLGGIKQALRWNNWDSAIALNLAFLVNAAILVLAATAFFKTGRTDVGEIQTAYKLLNPLLGNRLAPLLFAIALICSGQSSTITGTLAGQIVMEGYLRLRINPWLRRLLTRLLAIIPALIVLWIYGDQEVNQLIVLSQVILSLQLGFAVIPLIHFVSDKKTMGTFAIRRRTQVLAWAVAGILLYLNLDMVFGLVRDYFQQGASPVWKALIIAGIAGYIGLLAYTFYLPLRLRYKKLAPPRIHGDIQTELRLDIPHYKTIAIALEFSSSDLRIINHALGQASAGTEFVLIHIVESASARMLGSHTFDEESKEDERRLAVYVDFLQEKGFQAKGLLGYRNRIREILRLVRENKADMLVMGAHRHTGLQDFIHGETIDSVRHGLSIPVFVVNV
ncbi:Nramp family divalent metal transporter [Dinghuibacter silviterrae]|uniref:Divalent metal cation transporter MntH n=1 Tax=Dinghuibacter silviterrae TaxID=1539049 RepID=A0A4V3GKN3_9BACT|nr:Nramp family divalent metal transporter [Dinghuibacter silviterrae]TDW96282.1 manganese transport protein [Dinghuibacter silviterrae]